MTDFYEELNISQDLSVDEINRELNQLETTWRRREIVAPEKATKMLALILEARKIFRTDELKIEYDFNLEESKKPLIQTDYDAEREEQFQKYRKQAETYFLSENQIDLALEAIRRAQQYQNVNAPDASFLYLCSMIKFDAGDRQGALSEVTEAIVIDPNNPTLYRWKGDILGDFFNEVISNLNELQTARLYLSQNRSNYEKGLELAQRIGDKEEELYCLKGLAESYSLIYDSDYLKAEQYANKAILLGDKSPELAEILESIKQDKTVFQAYQGKNHPSTKSGGACYIATAVYGSYDCPEVMVLRQFRDDTLLKTWYGTVFVKVYYALSPGIVRKFGNYKWFNMFWRNILDKFVFHLRK